MSVQDYVGRTFDIAVLQGPSISGETMLQQQLFGEDGGQVCTGAQKVAQRWALEFLTKQGSVKFRPLFGSPFVTAIENGKVRTVLSASVFFRVAAAVVSDNLISNEPATAPDEDRFASADLLGIALGSTSLYLSVEIKTRAGDARRIILPVSVLPINTRA